MSLLPTYIEDDEQEIEETVSTPIEYEIDFNTGQLTGKKVEGVKAIKTWAWLALQVARYRYPIFTWDYGNEFEDLIGQGYSEEHIETELQRMLEDCLLINPDILGISDLEFTHGDILHLKFRIQTLYGEDELHV